ncbi:motility protein A [Nocardioides deserti]|uniref:Motility protein A n=1 Tax=Nocardioides deserti TaxID=1588644 RepID=A0ABR6UD88_9ACTN|nr:motility protein A [Nocardioides deserti]MBC2962414.1 motility protein A [Nocardioides deserti]GGO77953.1 motility protein A [Nocardioides deserti]
MDKATIVGVGGAFAVIITANILEGGNPMSMLLLPPMLLVFGATLFVSVAGGTLADAKSSVVAIKRAFTAPVPASGDIVPTVVSLADKARREGLLALEDATRELDDPFLVKGVTLAIDGNDPDEVRDILESEVIAKRKADKQAAKLFADAGAYAPTIGIVGTVMGLVHVLENLDQPETLGHSIAAAFLATLWGVLSANVIWLPIAAKLKRLSELEAGRMELIIEGVAAIQAGSNPRVVQHRLVALLPADQQPAEAA